VKDIRQALFSIFQAEHAQHLEQIRSILALYKTVSEADGKAMLDEAFRRAHTLKGAARAVDIRPVEELADGMESLLSRVREGGLHLDRDVAAVIHQALDSSEGCVAAVEQQQTPTAPLDVLRAMAQFLGAKDHAAAQTQPPPQAPLAAPVAVPPGTAFEPRTPLEMVRLPSENLDRLVRSTGQILAESSRQKAVTAQLTVLGRQIGELEAECDRFRNGSSAPLRHLAGTFGFVPVTQYIDSVEQKVRALAGQARTVRFLQQRSSWTTGLSAEQLRQDVWSARMAPVEDVFEGFRKMVRDLARDEGKEVEYRLAGSGARADRAVLQAIKDPVMHLLRNAISHGIESPQAREGKKKSPVGRLTLRIECERGRLVAEVDDDGRGVDLDAVARIAVSRGLMTQSEIEAATPETIGQIIFRAGFSTSPTVNHISGRGMGLSVVHETARRLQGDVSLRSRPGPGTAIVLSVPMSVSTHHVLLVRASGQAFGIPTHSIERICRVQPAQVETVEGRPVVNLEGRQISLYRLSHLLRIERGDPAPASSSPVLKIVLVRAGGRQEAVLVDEFIGDKDSLIQELGFPSPASGNVAGGILLGDGTVVVVLNPRGLVDHCTQSNSASLGSVKPAPPRAAQRILVVDDSITARSLERSILEANGFKVRVAVDGLEGLELAREEKPDLIVTDLQMPRLDGFGLLEALKADPRLSDIPVIIISSVERPEDQQRGLVLGADAYVVKRKFDEQELLETIRQIL
jgi:two-component system chemotaxis sensor kinase CheA